MDPNETFLKFVNCLCDGDFLRANEVIEVLIKQYEDGQYAKFPQDTGVPYACIESLKVLLGRHPSVRYQRIKESLEGENFQKILK